MCQSFRMTGYNVAANCPGCGSTHRRYVFNAGHANGTVLRVRRCLNCGLVHLATRLPVFEEELYSYYEGYMGRPRSEIYAELNTRRQRELLGWLSTFVSGRDLLDVGCGTGHLVDTALDTGWHARGIDLAVPAIEICASHALPCERVDFFDAVFDETRFDVIVMSELIEHVPNPRDFLVRACDLLQPDGILYLTTPNFGALSRRLAGEYWRPIHPEHLSYFDVASFRRLAASTGLRIEHIQTRNFAFDSVSAALHRLKAGRQVGSGGSSSRRSGVGPRIPEHGPSHSQRSRFETSQRLRRLAARSEAVGAVKEGINRLLDLGGLGDTLVCVARRMDR